MLWIHLNVIKKEANKRKELSIHKMIPTEIHNIIKGLVKKNSQMSGCY
jgi:hypothetical protein